MRAKILTSCVMQSHCSRKSSGLHRQGHQSRRLWLPLGPRGEEAVAAAAPSSSPRAPCAPLGRLATPDAHAQQLPRLLGCGSVPHLGGQAGRRGPEWACEAEGCHKHKDTNTHYATGGLCRQACGAACVPVMHGGHQHRQSCQHLPKSAVWRRQVDHCTGIWLCVSGVSCELHATKTHNKKGSKQGSYIGASASTGAPATGDGLGAVASSSSHTSSLTNALAAATASP